MYDQISLRKEIGRKLESRKSGPGEQSKDYICSSADTNNSHSVYESKAINVIVLFNQAQRVCFFNETWVSMKLVAFLH